MIARTGAFWEYCPEDYALIRDVTRRDPDNLLLALVKNAAFDGVGQQKGARACIATSG